MKKQFGRKAVALMFICLCMLSVTSMASADSSVGNLLRFIPATITVESESVTVEGYFINLNADCDVKNFKDFEMTVYKKGDELVSGSFDTINQFTVKSRGVKFQSFTFNGEHDLNVGTYECDDYFYAVFSCNFTTVR